MIFIQKRIAIILLQIIIVFTLKGQVDKEVFQYIQRYPHLKISVLVQSTAGEKLVAYHEDVVFKAASIIKIPLLIALYDVYGTSSGHLTLTDYQLQEKDKVGGAGEIQFLNQNTMIRFQDLARAMIIKSDNTATNIIINNLDIVQFNKWLKSEGYSHTRLNRKMMDTEAISKGIQNLITATEANRFVLDIYNRARKGDRKAALMLGLLHQCDDNAVMPAGLPSGTPVAHKSGLLPEFRGDSGIIFLHKPLIISIFVEGCSSDILAESIIADITRILYTSYSKS
jgi:beta-lactamase class A